MPSLILGMLVCVMPNLASQNAADHKELPWEGFVVYTIGQSAGIEPLDGSMARDVLISRLLPGRCPIA